MVMISLLVIKQIDSQYETDMQLKSSITINTA